MKKILFAAFAVMFAAGLVTAKSAPKEKAKECGKPAAEGQMRPEKGQMLKEFKEMKALVDAYNAAKTDKEKSKAEAAVKAKVAENYDRHIAFMEKRVKESEARLEKVKARLAEDKKADVKAKKVDEITKKILSGEKPTVFAPPQDGQGPRGFDKGGKKGFMKGGPRGPKADIEGAEEGDDILPPPPPDGEGPEDLPEAA